MAKALYFVFSDPSSPEREADYNRWYTEEHIPHAVALDGWQAGTRYRVWEPSIQPNVPPLPKYLAIYEWDVADPQAGRDALNNGVRDKLIGGSPTLGREGLRGLVYLPVSPRIVKGTPAVDTGFGS